MEDTKMIVKKRDLIGSADSRRMRKAGILPGVIYSDGQEAVSVQVEMHDFEQLLHHHTSESLIVDIALEGEGDMSVLVKDVQHHPVTSGLMHVDLMKISMDKVMHVSIPVELVGEAAGVKLGGIMDLQMHEVDVECLPGDLVEAIEVDVSDLNIGDTITVADLGTNDGKLKYLVDDTALVAAVATPNVETDEDEEVGSTEPEVINEKKVEE